MRLQASRIRSLLGFMKRLQLHAGLEKLDG